MKKVSMPHPPETRRPGRPKAEDAVNIQVRILAAARHLFVEHGISSVSMEAVAKVAGITKQTLYARFPNKEELYRGVANDLIGQWREKQGPLLSGFTSLEEALYQHTVGTLETATREASAILDHFLNEQTGRNPEIAKQIIGPIRTRAIQDIELILDAFSSPELKATQDMHAAAEYYFMCLAGKIQDLNTFRHELSPTALADWAKTAVKLFIKGYLAA
jgi:AcrR family transcriptional regulator